LLSSLRVEVVDSCQNALVPDQHLLVGLAEMVQTPGRRIVRHLLAVYQSGWRCLGLRPRLVSDADCAVEVAREKGERRTTHRDRRLGIGAFACQHDQMVDRVIVAHDVPLEVEEIDVALDRSRQGRLIGSGWELQVDDHADLAAESGASELSKPGRDLLPASRADNLHRLAAAGTKQTIQLDRQLELAMASFQRIECVTLFALGAQPRHSTSMARICSVAATNPMWRRLE
jgi:hypothetical protein